MNSVNYSCVMTHVCFPACMFVFPLQNILLFYAAVLERPILVANHHPIETNTPLIHDPLHPGAEMAPLMIMHHWINQDAEIGHWEALVRLRNKYDTSPLLIHLLDATLQHLYMHFVGADV